jgi:hypothetical protein
MKMDRPAGDALTSSYLTALADVFTPLCSWRKEKSSNKKGNGAKRQRASEGQDGLSITAFE